MLNEPPVFIEFDRMLRKICSNIFSSDTFLFDCAKVKSLIVFAKSNLRIEKQIFYFSNFHADEPFLLEKFHRVVIKIKQVIQFRRKLFVLEEKLFSSDNVNVVSVEKSIFVFQQTFVGRSFFLKPFDEKRQKKFSIEMKFFVFTNTTIFRRFSFVSKRIAPLLIDNFFPPPSFLLVSAKRNQRLQKISPSQLFNKRS